MASGILRSPRPTCHRSARICGQRRGCDWSGDRWGSRSPSTTGRAEPRSDLYPRSGRRLAVHQSCRLGRPWVPAGERHRPEPAGVPIARCSAALRRLPPADARTGPGCGSDARPEERWPRTYLDVPQRPFRHAGAAAVRARPRARSHRRITAERGCATANKCCGPTRKWKRGFSSAPRSCRRATNGSKPRSSSANELRRRANARWSASAIRLRSWLRSPCSCTPRRRSRRSARCAAPTAGAVSGGLVDGLRCERCGGCPLRGRSEGVAPPHAAGKVSVSQGTLGLYSMTFRRFPGTRCKPVAI